MASVDPGRAKPHRLSVATVSAWSGVPAVILRGWIRAGALPPAQHGWADEARDRVVTLRDLVLGMGVPVADVLVMLEANDRPE